MAQFLCLVLFSIFSGAHSTDIFDVYKNLDFSNLPYETNCGQQLHLLKNDTTTLLQMIDASAKMLPNGLLEGNMYNLGSFYGCKKIRSLENDIYGKYCLAALDIYSVEMYSQDQKKMIELNIQSKQSIRSLEGLQEDSLTRAAFISLGICVPDKCSAQELEVIFPTIYNLSLSFEDSRCSSYREKEKYSAGSIVTLALIGIVVTLALLSTSYDVFLFYTKSKNKHDILIAFSLLTNGKKLLQCSTNSNQILCLHGIRAISMMWVVISHCFIVGTAFIPYSNPVDIMLWFKDPANMIINGATVSVDTFLAAAGLVIVYTYMQSPKISFQKEILRVPLMYLHRYIRLTPIFAMMILLHGSGLIYMIGQGPLYSDFKSQVDICYEWWWTNLLYVQNYVNINTMCIRQSWYLAVDMQLFILAPIVLIPLRRYARQTLYFMYFLVMAGVLIPFLYAYVDNMASSMLSGDTNNFPYLYMHTHTRFGPYVIGMIGGYYIYQFKTKTTKFELSLFTVVTLWLITIGGLLACIYGGFDNLKGGVVLPRINNAFYVGLNRNAWAFCVTLAITLCAIGYGGPIDWFLQLPIFQFLSKLSYAMYIVHFSILQIIFGSTTENRRFSNFEIMFTFCQCFVLITGISMLYSLLYESPMIVLEKVIFRRCTSNESKENIDVNQNKEDDQNNEI